MNCRDAREQFDSARPGPVDRSGAEFASAMCHVAGCSDCREVVESREQFDRDVGRVMRSVAVPSRLKSQILDALRIAAEAETAERLQSATLPAPAPTSAGRRRWLFAAAGTVAVALLATMAVRFWPASSQGEPLLTVSDLREQATLTGLADLEPFDGNFAAKPPGGIWTRRGIRIIGRARGDLPDENGYHRVALYRFEASVGKEKVRGVLLAIPRRRLQDPPSRTMPDFADRAEEYARRKSGTHHSFAWQTDEFVYVCFIPKDIDGHSLQILSRAVSGPNA